MFELLLKMLHLASESSVEVSDHRSILFADVFAHSQSFTRSLICR